MLSHETGNGTRKGAAPRSGVDLKKKSRPVLITGGAGFIGSHVVRLFVNKYPDYRIVNLDALTYAGNLENLRDVESAPNYIFEKGDITDAEGITRL
ncbi:MAG: GDP-mannose 4,6-dehydratase, partial [Candidatus Binataceae bacterium]